MAIKTQNKYTGQHEKGMKYNIDNPFDKALILSFEADFLGKTWWQYLLSQGYARISSDYPEGAVRSDKLEEIDDASEKKKALERLKKRREFRERQDREMNNSLTT